MPVASAARVRAVMRYNRCGQGRRPAWRVHRACSRVHDRTILVDRDELQALLDELSPAERAQVLQKLVRDLGDAFPGIETDPRVCGGDACIVRTRIPVWLLVQLRQLGASEADLLRNYPVLRAEDLAAAWAYARTHRAEIDEQIRAHEAA
jgi:uncharacterized protein (DUF433 family)